MSDLRLPPLPAFLLAAGLGTRLRPLTEHIPKCLVPVGGMPLLGYWLRLLGEGGVAPLIVNTHHHAAAVRAFVQDSPWRGRVLLAHEAVLLGTAGTLHRHADSLRAGPFMVVHADNLSSFDVGAFRLAHARRPDGCVMTMMTFRTPTPQSCGILDLDGRGVVTAFHEKVRNPPGDLANGAVYIMEPEVLDVVASCGVDTPDISLHVIPRLLGRIATFRNDTYHRDIGTPESYAQALRDAERGLV